MSMQLDRALLESGTKFRIFPQPRYLSSFSQPETVRVSVPPDQMQPGPADARMFVVDAVGKSPYNQFTQPPYSGARNPAVQPGPDGHFDHIDPDSREFSCTTMYATVRRVLDIFEDYFGRPIPWHFAASFGRLELIPLIEWNNAQSGYGFLEFGFGGSPFGGIDHSRPYCQNFDVLAHELGHSIVFSTVGVPQSPSDEGIDYGGMHEAGGDLVAIVASLHFHSVVDHLLNNTKGNLFSVNELSRVGELSDSREIRVAFNYARLSEVGDEPHDRSLPLSGGFFDVLVEVYQKCLVARQLISEDLARRSVNMPGDTSDHAAIQNEFAAAYQSRAAEFKTCLLEARDYLGRLLAQVWSSIPADFLTYHAIVNAALQADQTLTAGAHQQTIRECFAWREIGPAPHSLLLRNWRLDQCGMRATVSAEAGPTDGDTAPPRRERSDGRPTVVSSGGRVTRPLSRAGR